MLQPPPKYNMNYLTNFLAMRNAAANAQTNPVEMTRSSPSANDIVDETQLASMNGNTKSFTIAAILGLKKNATTNSEQIPSTKQRELSVMNLSMHNVGGTNHCSTSNNSHISTHQTPMKFGFNAYDASAAAIAAANAAADNRLLGTRIPFPHHLSAHHHHSASHLSPFHGANNNNNGKHAINVNSSSALQSLQQQFHHKNSAFHTKEPRHKNEHSSGKSKSSLKSKRVRTIFTPEQLERLEAEFERQQYMVGPERLYLAHTLQLTEAQVKVWFQNRRIKWRKNHLEITQQRLAIIRQHQQMPAAANETNTIMNIDSSVNEDKTGKTEASMSSNLSATNTSELSICSDSNDSISLQEIDDL